MTSASPLGFGALETPPPVLRVVSAVLAIVLLPPQLERRPEDAFARDLDRDEPLFERDEPPLLDRDVLPLFDRDVLPLFFDRDVPPVFLERDVPPVFDRDVPPPLELDE